jgi:hypothetical protein
LGVDGWGARDGSWLATKVGSVDDEASGNLRPAVSEEYLQRAVDEVLEPAWPREKRRELLRLARYSMGRIVIFILALLSLSIAVNLLFGGIVPWTFFAFISLLTLAVGTPDLRERSHLRRH